MMYEYDVTIEEASLSISKASSMPVVNLMFLPHGLCFVEDRLVSRFYSSISNVHPATGWKRARLRGVLSMVCCDGPFTDNELSSMVGRRLRVGVEEVEFQDRLHLRVTTFLRYSGAVKNPSYSDNEYVFMIRELNEAEGG